MIRKVFFAIFLFFPPFIWAYQLPQTSIQDMIRLRLEADMPGESLSIRDQSLFAPGEIHRFYGNRAFREVWSVQGKLTELAYELRFEILQSQFDGLNPGDYHLGAINAFFETLEANQQKKSVSNLADLSDLDMLLTDAFFHLASDLERGKVNPQKLKSIWEITPKKPKIAYEELLAEALEKEQVRKSLEKLYPNFVMYRKGREVIRDLDEHRKVDTLDWKAVRIDKTVKIGDAHNGVPALRERLVFWNYLEPYHPQEPKKYDSLMFKAVQKFQQQNGMELDGALGKLTVSALNQSPVALMDKASVNMERLRWLPDTLRDAEMILVNIANYQLDYLVKLDTVFSARVIVGKQYHASPIFAAAMKYIVFGPYWNVPNSIARNEIIPAIRKDPDYLNKKNMEVVTYAGKLVDPASVDWSPSGAKSFPYMIRQRPGGDNSLGQVKFMFPNKHSVYIHDTPSRSLFAREDRALSHGCIRIQNPEKFAKILLAENPSWTDEKIRVAMNQTKEQIVNLNRPVPVVLLYLTFWADSRGQGHFRPDIYDRDAEVLELLKRTDSRLD